MAHITTLTRAYNDLYNSQANTYSYSGSFETFKESEVKVKLDGTLLTYNSSPSDNTQYSVNLTDKTIHVGGNDLTTGTLSIYPQTDLGAPTLKAPYTAGSAITATDLTNNQKQVMRKQMEFDEGKLDSAGDTMTGDLTMGEDTKIVFEGATDDGYETTLTVTDPTADRTITLPNVTGTVVTTGDTGSVATGMIAADAITGAKIADDQINSEHYVDGSIDTAHIGNAQVTADKLGNDSVITAKIQNSAVTTVKIADDAVTADKLANTSVTAGSYTATDITVDAQGRITSASSGTIAGSEIAADAIDGTKIADDSINSEHYVDGSIDHQHLANDVIDGDNIQDDVINSEHYVAGSIDHEHLANDAVDGDNIADDSINSEHYVDGSIATAHIGASQVETANIANLNVTTGKLADSAVATAKIAADAVTGAKIADDAVDSEHLAADSIDTEHYAAASVDTTALASNAVTEAKITDANVTTDKIANDAVTIGKIGCEQTTISNSDSHIPTSGAVVDYVAAQIAPIGGLEVIADEDNFPTSQPGSGVVISISDAAGIVVNGSGVSTTARTAGNGSDNVTINNFPSSLYNETLASGVGLMVSSTGSSHTYNYHKLLAAETDVKQLSDDINDFNARYRVSAGEPGSNNDDGDLVFDTNANKMKVYDATAGAWTEVTSTGDFKFLVPVDAGTTTAATFDGSDTSFDLKETTNSGSAASVTNINQLIVSLNGVIQKPNTGSYSASEEGFYLTDTDTIRFCTAPATGSSCFIIQCGSAVSIPTPGDGTVTAAKIASGAVTTVKLADANVTQAKLADQAVNEAKLQISNAPTNGYFLSAQSGNTGGLTWAQVSTDLSNDSSPQLGGDLASNGNDIIFADNDKGIFGTNSDLQIYHDSSTPQNLINSYTSNPLTIMSNGDTSIKSNNGDNMGVFKKDGAVELYYDNTKRFETSSAGTKVYGNLTFADDLNTIRLNDNYKIQLGTSQDLEIYHNGSNSIIKDAGTGYLLTLASGFAVQNAAGTETIMSMAENGSVDLYYDDSKKLETTTDGVQVTGEVVSGTLHCSGKLDLPDSTGATVGRVLLGTGDDLSLYHDGTDNYISASNGHLNIYGDGTNEIYIRGLYNEDSIAIIPNGAVELFHNNSKKFSTISGGAYVTGSFGVGAATNPSHNYNQGVHIHASGTGAVLHLTDNTSGSGANDGFDILSHDGAAYLWQRENANMIFGTNGNSRWSIYGSNGHFVPATNADFDIGTSSYRVRNIYTNDLHLSNEGSSNDVDGSWGNWTIQEGESDLFLKNNRSGKKYKFNLTEVS